MDNPTPNIADQVAAVVAAREAADGQLTALGEACRRVIVDLTAALGALTNDQPPARPATEPTSTHAEPAVATEPRPANPLIDAAVLRILHESPTGGVAMRVGTITSFLTKMDGFGSVDGRVVSQSLQRLHNANLGTVAVRPTTPKGYWIAADLKGMRPSERTAENGAPTAQDIAEPDATFAPEDDAFALEEAGVVRGDEWPSPDEYARI